MLASLTATLLLGIAGTVAQAPAKKGTLFDPSSLRADFNAAKGVPRVVIILSPS